MTKVFSVPFEKDSGNMIRIEHYWMRNYDTIEYVEGVDFEAEMEFSHIGYSGKSNYLIVKNRDTGALFSINPSDVPDYMRNAVKGRLFGLWRYVRNGPAYGIKLVLLTEDQ